MLEVTPGQLVFGRDMLLPIAFRANWAYIQNKKQTLINKNNQHENCNWQHHVYCVGDLITLEKPGIIPKMDRPCTGPHVGLQVFTNGTVCICRGGIEETVNICCVKPYYKCTQDSLGSK